MKHLFLTLFIITTFILAPAKSQDKAEKILSDLAYNLEQMDAMKIIFTYSMVNEAEDIHESYQGELLSQGEKYRLKITGQEVISDGQSVWTFIPEAEEVQLNEVENSEGGFNPVTIFDDYKSKFTSSYLKEITENNRSMAVIELQPIGEEQFSKAQITVDISKNELYSLSIFDEIGNTYTYQVKELLPNIALNGDEFTFNQEKYPDVEIIDMR